MRPQVVKLTFLMLIILICLALATLADPARQTQRTVNFKQTIQPFFAANCYMCHGADGPQADLNLESFQTEASVKQGKETWLKVLDKLRTGQMPPKGMPRPDKAETEMVIKWIEQVLDAGDKPVDSKPNPGRVTVRRLNRAEYNNTIRDLLGVDLRLADDFPQDDSGYGFDNIGDVLSLSPILMERYLTAAEKASRTALFGPERMKPVLVRSGGSNRKIEPIKAPPTNYDETGLSLPNSFHVKQRFPADGEYMIRFVLGGNRPPASAPFRLALWIDGQKVQEITFDPENIAAFSEEVQELGGLKPEFHVRVSAGEHFVSASFPRLYDGLPASYNGANPSTRPAPPPPVFRAAPDLTPKEVEDLRKQFEARQKEIRPINEARVSFLEIGGPEKQSLGASPASLKKIFVCGHRPGHHSPECLRQIVANFERRAYRRPVTEAEVNRVMHLASLVKKEGDSFEEEVCQALQAILVSPDFLFRIEKDRATAKVGADHLISQYELASRLSYFLWSSMPDARLLRLADQGTLRSPAVLTAQVRRMLKDPKSRALVENFGGQWLELRKLDSIKPDRNRFHDFDQYLRQSMRKETELFFDRIVRNDRSILDFIDGDYTFLNERLAEFYNIPDVKGPEFRLVSLTGNAQRSGVLTQASVLTVSSYATRTSPVLRGKWILDNLLNTPPPPPPADVPNLDDTKIGQSLSMRQQLEEHRKNPTCAACHVRMDPLGFGLENYNAIGAWRAKDGNIQIDASGVLPDGRSFNGSGELKRILKCDSGAFTEGLTEKLMTYALGRGVEAYDKPTVKQIADRVERNNYRFSSLILEIVRSAPFQKRRGDRAQ